MVLGVPQLNQTPETLEYSSQETKVGHKCPTATTSADYSLKVPNTGLEASLYSPLQPLPTQAQSAWDPEEHFTTIAFPHIMLSSQEFRSPFTPLVHYTATTAST